MSAGWTKRRVRFLAISGVLLVAGLLLVRAVLLPFILAVIVAYVLTPLVALFERWRVPRAAAILLVYAVTGTVLYVSIATASPRIYVEAVKLKQEVPALAHKLVNSWGPSAESRIDDFLGISDEPIADPRTTAAPIEIRPLADGGYGLQFNGAVDVVREDADHYRVVVGHEGSSGFDMTGWVGGAIEKTVEYIKRNALALIRVGQAIVSKTARALVLTFMTLMCAGYLMHTRDEIMEFFRSLPPVSARAGFDRLLQRVDRGLAGVVRGQLIICVVNGVLSAIGFIIFDLKYWPILAIIAGAMSIIPIFGSILSTIPAVLIGLTQDVWTALWVLIWILLIHQLEANLFNPKIIGVSAKLHPVLVVFALIVGEHFYGLWGALLAVPTLSLIQSLFNHFRKELDADTEGDELAPSG